MRTMFLLPICLLLFSFSGLAQNFQGVAVYESKTKVDFNMDGRQMSPEMKKRIEENMKKAFEKTYILKFDRSTSIYEEEQELEAPGAGGGGMFFRAFSNAAGGGKHFKNVQEGFYAQENEFMGKPFLVKDSLQKLDWQLTNESKKIGNYTVFKATAVRQVDSTEFTNYRFRGRRNQEANKEQTNPMDEVELKKEVTVVAWYTPELPVNQGPGKYWGLPGLILEVNDGNTIILCSKITINPSEKLKIKEPTKGKEVTQDEYNTIVMEKVKEMQENRGGGGFRSGNFQFRAN
ncbi:MAG: GLPGLI family protein [Flavobacteriaceae bacterium]|nr:GLPGLI family protein [Flavobacteriaceae bacterium]